MMVLLLVDTMAHTLAGLWVDYLERMLAESMVGPTDCWLVGKSVELMALLMVAHLVAWLVGLMVANLVELLVVL